MHIAKLTACHTPRYSPGSAEPARFRIIHDMTDDRAILDEIESDMSRDAGAGFTALVADYLAATRTGDGPVSTRRPAAELAARFDEPAPAEGRPLAKVLARLRDEVMPDCNRLYHPRYAGHRSRRRSRRRSGRSRSPRRSTSRSPWRRCRPPARRWSTAWCAGCATSRGTGRRRAAPSPAAAPRPPSPGCSPRGPPRSPTSGRTEWGASRRWWCAASTRTTRWRAPWARWGSGCGTWW